MTLSLKNTLLKGMAVTSTIFAATALSTNSVHALTVVNYDFGTDLGPTGTAPNISASTVTAGTPPGGSGITYDLSRGSDAGAIDGFSILFDREPSLSITDQAEAIANNSFVEFSVAPNSGTYTLAAINLRAKSTFTNSGGFALRSSADGFATNLLDGSLTTGFNDFNIAFAPQTISTPLSFRLYSWDSGGFATTGIVVDRILLDDGIPVPFGFTPLPGLAFAWVTAKSRKVLKRRKAKEAAPVA